MTTRYGSSLSSIPSSPVLDEARRLLNDITAGEWFVSEHDGAICAYSELGTVHQVALATNGRDDTFIAAAPRLVRDLLALVTTLTTERENEKAERAEESAWMHRVCDGHREMALRFSEDRDIKKHENRQLEADLTALRGATKEIAKKLRAHALRRAEGVSKPYWNETLGLMSDSADRLDRLVLGGREETAVISDPTRS